MKSYLNLCGIILLGSFLLGIATFAQDANTNDSIQKKKSQDPQHDSNGQTATGEHEMHIQTGSLLNAVRQHDFAGTDVEPVSTPSSMLMSIRGNWMLMLHGVAFLSDVQQSGPRGAAKLFSTNWIMPMAQRSFHSGTLSLRAMLSLEPTTVTNRRYPELFQQGETAFGRPIVDGQHPHDLFMELAAFYDLKLGEHALLSFYGAPVGDPAMGPAAYPHRASAAEDPVAPLGHHLEDSTHIADDVVTVGLSYAGFASKAPGSKAAGLVETGGTWTAARLKVGRGSGRGRV